MLFHCGQMADALAFTDSTTHMSNVYTLHTNTNPFSVRLLTCYMCPTVVKALLISVNEVFN